MPTVTNYIIRKRDLETQRDIAMNAGDTPAALAAIRELVALMRTPTTTDGRNDRNRS